MTRIARTALALVSVAGFTTAGMTAAYAEPVVVGPYSTFNECSYYRSNDPSATSLCFKDRSDNLFYYNADYGF